MSRAVVILFVIACSSRTPYPFGNEADAGVDATDAREPLGLSIATWNIEQFPRSPMTPEAARMLIEAQAFDLVGVQEITDIGAFIALAESLPEHDFVLSFDPRAFLQLGILYRTSLIEVGAVARIFADESSAFPRDPLVAQLTVRDDAGDNRFDFTFVVVHLKAQIDERSRQRRVEANVLLDGWIRQRALVDPDIVVVGDFNDELTDSPPVSVFGPYLRDTGFYEFLTLRAAIDGEFSFIPFEVMLDHILVTTDALEEYGAGTTEILAIDEAMPSYEDVLSDHRPVVSRFVIP